MVDPILAIAFAGVALSSVALTSFVALRGWRGWLELKRLELSKPGSAVGRIELAALRERVRRLEGIADGHA